MVTRAYEDMQEVDREAFRKAIVLPELSGGMLAAALRAHGYAGVDRFAVDHYRRKLQAGKAEL